VSRSLQVTPGGIRVCGHEPLTDDELAAVDELADAACRLEERRRAALSPAELAAEDERRAAGRARLRRLQEGARA
jgi:hypothetical protein